MSKLLLPIFAAGVLFILPAVPGSAAVDNQFGTHHSEFFGLFGCCCDTCDWCCDHHDECDRC